MGFGTGLFTVITAHAERLVDQQHVGSLADTLADQERDDAATAHMLCGHVGRQAAFVLVRNLLLQLGILIEQELKILG